MLITFLFHDTFLKGNYENVWVWRDRKKYAYEEKNTGWRDFEMKCSTLQNFAILFLSLYFSLNIIEMLANAFAQDGLI